MSTRFTTNALVLAASVTLATVGVAKADTVVPDPLHGYCASGCIDNGNNSPVIGQPSSFGFTDSDAGPSGLLGTFELVLLVPTNDTPVTSPVAVTGTYSGGAFSGNLVVDSAGTWSSGNLADFLGLKASPDNPIGNYTGTINSGDPTATAFDVFTLTASNVTLEETSQPNVSPLLNLGSNIPDGSYLVAFFNPNGNTGKEIATANSGAILETTTLAATPLPGALPLFGSVLLGGLGMAGWRKRRARGPVSVLA